MIVTGAMLGLVLSSAVAGEPSTPLQAAPRVWVQTERPVAPTRGFTLETMTPVERMEVLVELHQQLDALRFDHIRVLQKLSADDLSPARRMLLVERSSTLHVREEDLVHQIDDALQGLPSHPPHTAIPIDHISWGHPLVIRPSEHVRNAVVFGADLVVLGHIDHQATSFGGNVLLLRGAHVDGPVYAFGGQTHHYDQDAVTRSTEPTPVSRHATAALWLLATGVGSFLLALGWLPVFTEQAFARALEHPLRMAYEGSLLALFLGSLTIVAAGHGYYPALSLAGLLLAGSGIAIAGLTRWSAAHTAHKSLTHLLLPALVLGTLVGPFALWPAGILVTLWVGSALCLSVLRAALGRLAAR